MTAVAEKVVGVVTIIVFCHTCAIQARREKNSSVQIFQKALIFPLSVYDAVYVYLLKHFSLSFLKPSGEGKHEGTCQSLTSGDDSLQSDDVGVVKLAHDAGLAQKVPPLLVCVSRFEGFYSHADLTLSRHFETAAAHLPEFAFKAEKPGLNQKCLWYIMSHEISLERWANISL